MLWPIAIALASAIAVAVADQSPPARTGQILAFVACLVILEAQQAPVTQRWTWHIFNAMGDAEYLRGATPEGGAYDDLLAALPRDDAVAIWVQRPELVDYHDHRVFDLRGPRAARLRGSSKLAEVLSRTRAKWLLYEDDGAYDARAHASFGYRWLCPPHVAVCSDALERIVLERPTVSQRAGVRVIALR
jgi:hypothetical protein